MIVSSRVILFLSFCHKESQKQNEEKWGRVKPWVICRIWRTCLIRTDCMWIHSLCPARLAFSVSSNSCKRVHQGAKRPRTHLRANAQLVTRLNIMPGVSRGKNQIDRLFPMIANVIRATCFFFGSVPVILIYCWKLLKSYWQWCCWYHAICLYAVWYKSSYAVVSVCSI